MKPAEAKVVVIFSCFALIFIPFQIIQNWGVNTKLVVFFSIMGLLLILMIIYSIRKFRSTSDSEKKSMIEKKEENL